MEALMHLATVGLAGASSAVPWSTGKVLGKWGFAFFKKPAAVELFTFEQRFTMDIISFLLYVGLASAITAFVLYMVEQNFGIGKSQIIIHYFRVTLLIAVAVAEIVAAIAFVYGLVFSGGGLWLGDVGPGLYVSTATALSASLALTLSRHPRGGQVLSPPTPISLPVAARVAGASGILHYGSVRERPQTEVYTPSAVLATTQLQEISTSTTTILPVQNNEK
jgi:hypothetical protein